MSESSHAEVGFKRPPAKTRRPKRVSGNPKGRPKGARNFKTDLQETLAQPVQVTEHGRSRKISTQRAGLERLREKALRGDQRALDSLLELAERHAEAESATLAEGKLSDQEGEVLEHYTNRIREQVIAEFASSAPLQATASAPPALTQNLSNPTTNEENNQS